MKRLRADSALTKQGCGRAQTRDAAPTRRRHRRGGALWTGVAVLAALLLAGCGPKQAAGPMRAGMAVQVVTAAARRQPVNETIALIGDLAANEAVEIKSETDGIIQEIPFNEGQQAAKGQLLVLLDETKFAATVAEGEANFKLSQANFDRSQQLFRDKLISQQEFDQMSALYGVNRASLELKRRQLKDARIYAPFEGVLGARLVSPGQVISRNTLLTTLVDLDPLKLEVNVPERFLGQLRVGQTLEVAVVAFPGRKFAGEVYFIAAQVAPNTRTALVKARLANPKHELKPGMFASLGLTVRLRESAIVVPETALLYDGDNARVFVVGTNQTAQVRPVKFGLRLPGLVEVLEGLTEGDAVIIEGVQKVVPNVPVRVAGAAGPAAPAAGGVPAGGAK